MYSVMVVDDEQPVIDSICYIIEQYRPDLDIAATALSGMEAVQKATETRPDILFIDIRMPGIDGLEALRQIHSVLPNAVGILATAYERFDIARSAFRVGVTDYVVKPFTRDTVLQALDGAVQQLRRQQTRRGSDLAHLRRLHELLPHLEETFVRGLERGAVLHSLLPIFRELASIDLDAASVTVVTGGDSSGEDRHIGEAADKLKYKWPCISGRDGAGRAVFVFPARGEEPQVPPEHEWSAYLGDPAPVERFRVSNGGVYRGDALPASYREALSGLATADYEVSRDEAMPVVDALRRGEEGEARRVFEQLISARGDDRRPWARAAALYAVVLWELHGTVVAAPVETGDDPLSAIWNALLERLPARRATADLSKAPTPLRAAASHIRAHYQSPLQLADVAEIAGVSPAYLSQLFTKYCRMGFTDYLTGVRVERAKELLAGESRSVKEVGRLVGYSDPNYFSRVFRRLTGRSPSAYLDDD